MPKFMWRGVVLRLSSSFLSAVIFVAPLATPGLAQDATWTGATDRDFFDGANWSGSLVPGEDDLATFDGPAFTAGRTANLLGGTATLGGLSVLDFDRIQNGTIIFDDHGAAAQLLYSDDVNNVLAATLTLDLGDEGLNIATSTDLLFGGTITNAAFGGVTTLGLSSTGAAVLRMSGAINGDAGTSVLVTGGTVVLSGTNSFGGGTVVDGGSLFVSGGAALSNEGAVTVNAGGTLVVSDTEVIGTLAGTGAVRLNTGRLALRSDVSGGFSGTITGANGLSLGIGAGNTFTLNGVANSYQDTTSVSSGTLVATGGGAIGDSSIVVLDGGALRVNAEETVGGLFGTGAVTLNDRLILNGDRSLGFGGNIDGAGGLTVNAGAGNTVTLTGTNTYGGSTRIGSGAVIASGGNAIGDSSIVVLEGGSLQVNGPETVGGLFGSSGLTLNNTLTVNGDRSLSFGGAIDGSGGLVVNAGAGNTVTLAGSNTFAGGTAVNTGRLAASGGSALSNSGAVTVGAGGTLVVADTEVIGTLAGTGGVDLDGGRLSIAAQASGTFSGTVTGTDGLAFGIGSANTFTLNGTGNDYAGSTRITSGTLIATGGGAIGDSSIVQLEGGTLQVDVAETVGGLFGTSDITLNDTLTVNGDRSLGFGGSISGAGGLTVNAGTGNTVTLTGTNDFTGATAVNSGRLAVSGGAALSNSGVVTVASGGTLTVSQTEVIGTLAGDGRVELSGGRLGIASNTSGIFSGTITGSQGLAFGIGTGNAFTLDGTDNDYVGHTNVSNGTLIVTGGAAIGDRSTVVLNTGALQVDAAETIGRLAGTGAVTLNAALTIAGDTNSTFGGTLSGSGSLTNAGDATVTLSGANPGFSGDVAVSGAGKIAGAADAFGTGNFTLGGGGTLEIANSSALAADLSTVSGGGTLATSAGQTITIDGGINAADTLTLGDGVQPSSFVINSTTITGSGAVAVAEQASVSLNSIQSGQLLANGAQLDGTLDLLGRDATAGGLNGTGVVTSSGAADVTLTLDAGGSFAGVIEDGSGGTVGLNVDAAGQSVALSGTNTFTGETVVENGILALGAGNTLRNDASVTVGAGGTLDLQAGSETIGSLAGEGAVTLGARTLTIAGGTATTFAGIASGTGSLALDTGPAGGLTLTQTQVYTGDTRIENGTLVLGAADVLRDNGTVVLNGGTLDLGAFDETIGNLDGGASATGVVNLNAQTLTVAGTGTTVFGGQITGAGGLTVDSTSGNLRLTGNNSYTGATQVNSGTLRVSGGAALDDASAVSVDGTLVLLNGESIGSLAGTGTVQLNNGTMRVVGNETTTFGGTIEGVGALILESADGLGGGTLTLTGTHTYTGATRVEDGTLVNQGQLAGALRVNGGVVTNTGTILGDTRVTGGMLNSTGNLGALTVTGGIVDLSGVGSTVGSLDLRGGTTHISPDVTVTEVTTTVGVTNDSMVTTMVATDGLMVNSATGEIADLTVEGSADGATGAMVQNAGTIDIATIDGGTLTNTNLITGQTTVNAGVMTTSGTAAGIANEGGVVTVSGGTVAALETADGQSTVSAGMVTAVTSTGGRTDLEGGSVDAVMVSDGVVTVSGSATTGMMDVTGGMVRNAGTVAATDLRGGSFENALGGEVTGDATVGDGGILIAGGGTFGGAVSLLADTGAGAGTLQVDAALTLGDLNNLGIVTVSDGLTLTAGAITNDGEINLGAGARLVGTTNTLTNNARITLADGATIRDAGAVTNAVGGTITLNGSATLDADSGDAGNVFANLGDLTTVDAGGDVITIGNGTADVLNNSGAFTIGASDTVRGEALTLTNTGTLTIGSGATLDVMQLAIDMGLTRNAGRILTDGTIALAAAGTLENSGELANDVTSAGTLTNSGTMSGVLTVTDGVATNSGTGSLTDVNVEGGIFDTSGGITGVAELTGGVTNITAGTVNAVNNSAATLNIQGGSVASLSTSGDTTNDASLDTVTVSGGTFENTGQGSIGTAQVNGGTFTTAGTITTAINNAGDVAITGGTVAALNNEGSATISAGNVAAVSNTGSVINNSAVGSLAANAGTFTNNGSVSTANVGGTASFSSSGTVGTLNNAGGQSTVQSGSVLEAANSGGTLTIQGGSVGSLTSNGITSNNGTVGGATIQGGSFNNSGNVTGNTVIAGGDVTNVGTLGGVALGSGSLTNTDGSVGPITNSGGNVTINGGNVGTIANLAGTVTVAAAASVGEITNEGQGSNAGTIANLTNVSGTFNNSGTVTVGTVISGGVVTNSGDLGALSLTGGALISEGGDVGNVTNTGADLDFSSGTVGDIDNQSGAVTLATSGGAVSNADQMLISGVAASLQNTAGTTTVTGTVNGLAQVQGGSVNSSGTLNGGAVVTAGALTSTGSITGTVQADGGVTTLSGALNGALEAGDGQVVIDGTLTGLTGITNDGANPLNVAQGSAARLAAGSTVSNAGTMVVAGELGGTNVALSNSGTLTFENTSAVSATITNSGAFGADGTVTGDLINTAGNTANLGGTLTGSVVNAGTVNAAGLVTGDVTNSDAFNLAGAGQINGNVNNTGQFDLAGVVQGDFANIGTLNLGGSVLGTVTNTGNITLDGDGTVGSFNNETTFVASAGRMAFSDFTNTGDMTVEGTADLSGGRFVNETTLTLRNGGQISSGTLINNTTLNLAGDGSIGANVTNNGLIEAQGTNQAGGNLVNAADAVINMAGNGRTDDVLTVTGNARIDGTVNVDISLDGPAAGTDRINIEGQLSGNVMLRFTDLSEDPGPLSVGQTVLKYGSLAEGFTFDQTGLPDGGATIYGVANNATDGSLVIFSGANPAIAGVASGLSLTQSLFNTVVNRPTSPFVTGLGFDDGKPCGVGTWARGTGGTAEAEGQTSTAIGTFGSSLQVNYAGLQAGLDYSCFDGRYAGFDLSFGAIAGYNAGSLTQPVFRFVPETGLLDFSAQTSVNETDFTQTYGGVYLNGTRDRLFADIQLRYDQTSFDFANIALPAALPDGSDDLGVADQSYKSRGTTVSGSVAYIFPLNEQRGISFIPAIGASLSRSSVDPLHFDRGTPDDPSDDGRLEIGDIASSVGFISGTVARSQVLPDGNSAINMFGTVTYYNDFGAATNAEFFELDAAGNPEGSSLSTSSENLGGYTELSLGVNYTKLLNPGSAASARRFDASARVDARFSEGLEGYAVTAQMRWQF